MSVRQPAIPQDMQSIVDELARSEREARELIEGLTDEQLNWQPNGAAWSMARCLDHLARINTTYTVALRTAVRESDPSRVPRRAPISPGWFSRFFIHMMDAPPRRKFSAPTQAIPFLYINGEDALKSFVDSHDEVRALVVESVNVDLNRIRFKNPFVRFLAFTVGAGFLIISAHDRRHLWQARQVRNALPR